VTHPVVPPVNVAPAAISAAALVVVDGGAVIMMLWVPEVWPSGLITRTDQVAPVVPKVKSAFSCDALTKLAGTVVAMLVVRLVNVTVAAVKNCNPLRVMVLAAVEPAADVGLMLDRIGPVSVAVTFADTAFKFQPSSVQR